MSSQASFPLTSFPLKTESLQDYARFREVMGYLDRILRERQKQFVALLEKRRAEAAKADAS